MVCLQCGSNTQVFNSRLQKKRNQVWRRRKCATCGTAFTTIEVPEYSGSVAVRDKEGRLAPFSRDKLLFSLHASLQHRVTAISDATALTDTVISRLLAQAQRSIVEDTSIINTAYIVLARFDKAASVHYQAFHNF